MSNYKKNLIGVSAAAVVLTMMMTLGILNYDSSDFYQSDLDIARARLQHTEANIDTEHYNTQEQAKNLVKQTEQYAELRALTEKHAQNPEANAYLEPKMDSLSNVLDSMEHDTRLKFSGKLDEYYATHSELTKKIAKLEQDSVIADSIHNQPIGPRFKNNWNRIFAKQR